MKLIVKGKEKTLVVDIPSNGTIYEYNIDHPDLDGYEDERDEIKKKFQKKVIALIAYAPRSFEEAKHLTNDFFRYMNDVFGQVSDIELREFVSDMIEKYPNHIKIER